MQWIDRMRQVKILLVVMAVVMSVGSLVISHFLVRDLKREEQRKMEIWAEAMRSLNSADEYTDLTLVLTVLNSNSTIPVVVLDREGEVQDYRNIPLREGSAEEQMRAVKRKAQSMMDAGRVIRVYLSSTDYMEICYADSLLLRRLAWWPYVQLGLVFVFVVVAIFALLSSKRAEQNKVWVGLSKETAHQLGTPISSLMAWQEMLRETYPDDELLPEMGKDVERLQRIAERFSKIGSLPELRPESLNEVLSAVTQYISRRASNRVRLTCTVPQQPLIVPMCSSLFEWVVENLCKNAIDAMDGQGSITLTASTEGALAVVEVADTGKGIPKNKFRTVFTPGFTTKKRGWGLGLSLAKRIVEEYHHGRIYVKNSEVGRGTTFRIELKMH
ncbi:MAG: HAMP domain-containing sensor histidine kinase [Bacteroidaceae bacterium]|nr:HAMP domain-containing histidine kinase [Prevotellaceae bacterium]MDY5599298.1 HAMP domain-containing sensor histidine kinase [Bacteroidaceae bacterium]MDY5674208.1 HAMP domain-containing sensor histidine kinase [Bacteroidaceae bacterium]